MSQDIIYSLQNVSKHTEAKKNILQNIYLSFFYGAKIGVLGINGSGKSSLLKVLAGQDQEFIGEAIAKKNIKIGYLPQEPTLNAEHSVRQAVEEGIQEIKTLLNQFNDIILKFNEPLTDNEMNNLLQQQGELQNKIDAVNGWECDRLLDLAADALRLPPWDTEIKILSGGEKRRVALCRLLLSSPDLLLLDEPTNHLDAESVAWLERFLQQFKGTVIAITHDRYFLDNVAEWILELDRGRGHPFKGNYSSWLQQKETRLLTEEKQDQQHKRSIKAELDWVQTNPKGRHAKNKARISRFEELSSREFQKQQETQELYIPPGPRLGDVVISINNLTHSYGDKVLIDNFSCIIPKAAIVGIIGPNGAGKTSLFKILTNIVTPTQGTVTVGETVKLAYVDQSRDSLDPNKTIWEEISQGADVITVGQFQMPSRAYVGRFNFSGSDQQKIIGTLSGGERNRVHLAKLLQSGGNVLLLDEPTNDLDVATLRSLEEAILNFPGCVLIISHDRWFLDRITTHIMAFEDEGKIAWFQGTYSEYEENKLKALGEAALQPHRIKYKKIPVTIT